MLPGKTMAYNSIDMQQVCSWLPNFDWLLLWLLYPKNDNLLFTHPIEPVKGLLWDTSLKSWGQYSELRNKNDRFWSVTVCWNLGCASQSS